MTMDALIADLARNTERPLGTVVHVGAGNGMVLEPYARLGPSRLVLVEGADAWKAADAAPAAPVGADGAEA